MPLVPLLGAAPRVANGAAGALWNLSFDAEAKKSDELRRDLGQEAGAIRPLVALLHGRTARAAAGALRNLAPRPAGVAAIRSAGGIPPLVALLHGTTARAAAARARAQPGNRGWRGRHPVGWRHRAARRAAACERGEDGR